MPTDHSEIDICVDVATSSLGAEASGAAGGVELGGMLNVSVRSMPSSFRCSSEPWRLAPGGAVIVAGDGCWRENVLANIEDFRIHWDSAANTLLLQGTHHITPLVGLNVRMLLREAAVCEQK